MVDLLEDSIIRPTALKSSFKHWQPMLEPRTSAGQPWLGAGAHLPTSSTIKTTLATEVCRQGASYSGLHNFSTQVLKSLPFGTDCIPDEKIEQNSFADEKTKRRKNKLRCTKSFAPGQIRSAKVMQIICSQASMEWARCATHLLPRKRGV